MAQIPFTLRELKGAWRLLWTASSLTNRSNAHRLLMLYSIECGLKAVLLKRESRSLFAKEDIVDNGHDLNKILKKLRLPFSLPGNFSLSQVKDNGKTIVLRDNYSVDSLHQAWRYGARLMNPPIDDSEMEKKLEVLQTIIEKELN